MDVIYVSKRRAEGATYQEIANEVGVTKQRIQQICVKHNLSKPEAEKLMSDLAKRKSSFSLGADLYGVTALRFSRKKQNAKNSKWEFTLEFDDLEWPTHCPILGLKLEYDSPFDKKVEASVSFDRIDSTKGYVKGNVRIISWRANRIKNDGTAEEHRKIAEYLDKYDV